MNDYLQQTEELQEKLQALMSEQNELALERTRLVGVIARAVKEHDDATLSFEMWAAEQNLLGGSNDAARKQSRLAAFENYKNDERWGLATKQATLDALKQRDQELQMHLARLHETLSALKLLVNLLDMQMAYGAEAIVVPPSFVVANTLAETPTVGAVLG